MGPHLECGFEKQINYVNYHLLGHTWVSHTDYIDNSAVVLQLESPGTGIQVLGQGADPGESVQRYDDSPAAVPKERVTCLFEQAKMKLLDSIHHFTKVILLDSVLHLRQRAFQVV